MVTAAILFITIQKPDQCVPAELDHFKQQKNVLTTMSKMISANGMFQNRTNLSGFRMVKY